VTTPESFLSQLTGLFASPAAENPTVAMIEAAYRHHGIDARYINCEVAPKDLEAAVRGAVAMGWVGFNCSLPHKEAVIPYLDEIAESARLIGAVNCVVIRDGHVIGENTDGQGFIMSLRRTIDPRGQTVLVFGAGGAARAITVELALAGAAQLIIVNRSAQRSGDLAQLIRDRTSVDAVAMPWSSEFAVPQHVGIVVNATSIGLFPNVTEKPDIDYDTLTVGMVVADVIPNPPRTAFLKEAEARGCIAIDGLGMLVDQAVIGIRHWNGFDASADVMRSTLNELFS
jgi:shikimate dehydrogenase